MNYGTKARQRVAALHDRVEGEISRLRADDAAAIAVLAQLQDEANAYRVAIPEDSAPVQVFELASDVELRAGRDSLSEDACRLRSLYGA